MGAHVHGKHAVVGPTPTVGSIYRSSMRRDRFIVVSNEEKHVYRILDTVENKFIRRFRYRAHAMAPACAANNSLTRTGTWSWPWDKQIMSSPTERARAS